MIGADTVLLDGQEVAAVGSRTVTPDETTEYGLVATNRRGSSEATATIRVRQPDTAPLVASFTAEPEQIDAGGTSVLSWHVLGADTISITPELGQVPQAVGSRVVTPAATTRYTLTASNDYGAVSATVTVRVATNGEDGLPLIAAFSASPEAIDAGQGSTLSWSVEGADEITISELGTVGSEGSRTVNPSSTTEYTLRASNSSGTATRSVKVHVREDRDGPPLIALFSASPARINPGATATLRWAVVGADSVSINQGIGSVTPDASLSVQPAATTTYTLTASNEHGQSQRSVTITVGSGGNGPGTDPDPDPDDPDPDPEPPVVAAFLADPMNGPAPLQTTFYWVIPDPDSQVTGVSVSFGDGSSTSSSNPNGSTSHTYGAAGNYTAVLNASLADGGSITRSTTIAVTGSQPPAEQPQIEQFSVSPDEGRVPLTVTFDFRVGGNGPLNCLIDFGDGAEPQQLTNCSTGNIGHEYTSPGTYRPVFIVTDSNGGVDTSSVSVTVRPADGDTGTLISSFNANPRSGDTPLSVSFTWQLSAAADTWLFFGDGSEPLTGSGSGSQNHTYSQDGRYPAVLLAVADDGTHDLQHIWISVGSDGVAVPTALVRTGSTLVQLNQGERSLLGPLLAGLLGTGADLSLLSNSALLTADVNLFELLDVLAADLGVSEPEAVLLGSLDITQVLAAALDLLSGTSAALPLQELLSSLPSGALPVELGELLRVDPDNILALREVDLNVLDLTTLLVQLFNASNVALTPTPVEIGLHGGATGGLLGLLGLDSVLATDLADDALARLWLQVVEPPVFTFAAEDALGASQAGFRSAGVRLAVELSGLGLSVNVNQGSDPSGLLGGLLGVLTDLLEAVGIVSTTATVDVNLTELSVFAEVGSFDGYVSAIDVSAPSVTLNAGGSLTSLHLGQLDHSVFFDRNRTALPEADFGTIASVDLDISGTLVFVPVLTVKGSVEVLARANTSRNLSAAELTVPGPYPQNRQLASAGLPAQVGSLLDSLELELGAGLGELSLLGVSVTQLTTPLLNLVTGLLNSVLGLTDDTVDLGATLPLDDLLTGLLGSDLFRTLGLDLGSNEITVLDLIRP